jgi:hypothetical protein
MFFIGLISCWNLGVGTVTYDVNDLMSQVITLGYYVINDT